MATTKQTETAVQEITVRVRIKSLPDNKDVPSGPCGSIRNPRRDILRDLMFLSDEQVEALVAQAEGPFEVELPLRDAVSLVSYNPRVELADPEATIKLSDVIAIW